MNMIIKRLTVGNNWLKEYGFIHTPGDDIDGFEYYQHSVYPILRLYKKPGDKTVTFNVESKEMYSRSEVEDLLKIIASTDSLEDVGFLE